MADFFLRTESIKTDDILTLSVTSESDKKIIEALKSSEPCLLEGARGTGKSFLMRVAELELESDPKSKNLTVFISFASSSLVNTGDPLQFYNWMLAKTLRAMLNKLRRKGYVFSAYSSSLLGGESNGEKEQFEGSLGAIVEMYEASYKNKSNIDIETLPDIESVKDAIESICQENSIDRVFFFFDEAAHVFRPDQQRQFFGLFKDLRSPYISCNAAIYPGVTYFGSSFELTHDCILKKIERDIRDSDYIDYFTEIVLRQADEELKNTIEKQKDIFNTLAVCCGGNPRILLKTIQDLQKFNTNLVNQLIKNYYREKIWSEHTELGEKYNGHKSLIDWGRDFLEKDVIPSIEKYNESRKDKGVEETSIYFWVHKDAPESVKESLRLLSYTGIIRKVDSSIRATRGELGTRYEVKYGCIISLQSSPVSVSASFFKGISIKKFPEFGRNHQAYTSIKNVTSINMDDGEFQKALLDMLKKPIDVLQLLTEWQKEKLKSAGIYTIEDLQNCSEEQLAREIDRIGPKRSRQVKNAADAELLEYLSG